MRRASLALALGLLAAAPVRAEIYRYTDEGGIAHYVDGMEAVPSRYRAVAVPLGLRNARPAAPPARPEPGAGEAVITFTPGRRILTTAHINDGTPVQLLVDTGADVTVISPRALVAAGVNLTRATTMQQMTGATGAAEARRVMIESLAVGRARVGRMTVFVHDLNQLEFDGLLGRDFLEQFNVSIDPRLGVVTIRPR